MSKKIFISPSNQDGNPYSGQGTNEYVQCKAIGALLEEALLRCGFETKLECEPTMQQRVKDSNAWGADMHICIHTNAAGSAVGGTQVYYGSYPAAAKAVFDRLAPVTPGESAERCYKNAGLYEVKYPNAVSVYVEAEFHHVAEQAKWIVEHKPEIADAICKGICDYYKVDYVPPVEESKIYRVQVGAFSVKENADNFVKKLKEAGFSAYIV